MIIAKLNGRLGNQMFVYATAFALSKKYGQKLAIYRFEFDVVSISEGYQLRDLRLDRCYQFCHIPFYLYGHTIRRLGCKIINTLFGKQLLTATPAKVPSSVDLIKDVECQYTPLSFNNKKDIHILDGFWQSPIYFDEYKEDILRQFQPNYTLTDENNKWVKLIKDSEHSVSLHIRRGDYVKIGICLSLDYYEKAASLIIDKHPESTFFVFSDDIDWVSKNLKLLTPNVQYVSHLSKVRNFDDIWLMSKCDDNIIANSSYSWWGAYLNPNKEKMVIAPQRILRNNDKILLPDWVVLNY